MQRRGHGEDGLVEESRAGGQQQRERKKESRTRPAKPSLQRNAYAKYLLYLYFSALGVQGPGSEALHHSTCNQEVASAAASGLVVALVDTHKMQKE